MLKIMLCSLAFLVIIWVKTRPNHDLTRLIFCDVGQGDAILISQGSTQVLVDAGPSSSVLQLQACLLQHLPPGDRTIEVILATHPDADHIGGLAYILRTFDVKHVLKTTAGKDTAEFSALEKQLSRGEDLGQWAVHCPQPLQHINLEGISRITVLSGYCLEEESTRVSPDPNNLSIVVMLESGSSRALLTGDIDASVEQALISRGLIIPTQILKAAHHGSKTATSMVFLAKVEPEIVVISAGKNNTYRHPHAEVLERLTNLSINNHRTDIEGTLPFISNGSRWLQRT